MKFTIYTRRYDQDEDPLDEIQSVDIDTETMPLYDGLTSREEVEDAYLGFHSNLGSRADGSQLRIERLVNQEAR